MNGQTSDDLVFGFERPHKPGTVCGFPCAQCGSKTMVLSGPNGARLPPVPFFIVAEATAEDWSRNVRANGGTGAPRPGDSRYFYFVRAD